MGHVVVAWLWLRQASLVQRLLDGEIPDEEAAFLRGKITACRYVFRYELPTTEPTLDLLSNLDDTCLEANSDEL